jgi:hypothetical protein
LEITSFEIQPLVGFFINDHWVVGTMSSYFKEEEDIIINVGNPNNSYYYLSKKGTTTFEVGAFARYYHPITTRFFFLGQVNAGYSNTDITYELLSTNSPSYFSSFSPNIVYLPLPWLGIEISAGEIRAKHTKDTDEEAININLNPSSLKLGISLYLGRQSAAE